MQMELCDGRETKDYPADMQQSHDAIEGCDAVVFGMPVYQYSMSGVLKNFIDICGGAFRGKHIGIITNAGGPNCYMASRDLFNSMLFEHHTHNLMPTPYAWSADFENGEITNGKLIAKLEELADILLNIK